MVQVAEEIISLLASDPQAALKITVEINADFPEEHQIKSKGLFQKMLLPLSLEQKRGNEALVKAPQQNGLGQSQSLQERWPKTLAKSAGS